MIAATIAALPVAQRTVIGLRDIEGRSSDEVCEALEISAGNQRILLHRRGSRVRAAIESYYGAVGATDYDAVMTRPASTTAKKENDSGC